MRSYFPVLQYRAISRAFVSMLLVGAILLSSALAVTVHVPADQATVQAGIDAAGNGDTVLVAPGSYTGLLSYPSHPVVVKSSAGAEETHLCHPGGSASLVSAIDVDSGAVFEGFTVSGLTGLDRIVDIDGVTTGFEVKGNRIIDCSAGSLIRVGWDASALVIRNLLVRWGNGNSIVAAGPGCRVINNTMDSGKRGVAIYGSSGVVLNNIVVNIDEYAVRDADSTAIIDYNNFWNYGYTLFVGSPGSPGANGISADPLFVDAGADDYRLAPWSPCVDAGHPGPAFTDVDGTPADIGVYPHLRDLPAVRSIRVGGQDNMHVLDHAPSIRWIYTDSSGPQTAHEIEVGLDTLWDMAELWAPGVVWSGDTAVAYGGGSLIDGETYYLRVRVNNGASWGGWSVTRFRMNAAPDVPVHFRPLDGARVNGNGFRLAVRNSSDSQADTVTYDFEVFSDIGLMDLVASEYGVSEGDSVTRTGLLSVPVDGNHYWWRARAFDGYEHSAWSAASSFLSVASVTLHVPADHPTIRAASVEAVEGDTILLADGVYTGEDNRDIDFGGKRVVLKSVNGPLATTIDCQAAGRGFIFENGEDSLTIVDGITVTRGLFWDDQWLGSGGGAVLITNASPTFRNCVFSHSRVFSHEVAKGGAVYCVNSGSIFEDCEFRGNKAESGMPAWVGGAIAADRCMLRLSRCRFISNNGDSHIPEGDGGAIWAFRTALVIDTCSFTLNSATTRGGMISGYGTQVHMRSTLVEGNSSLLGGGIRLTEGGSLSIEECTFTGNSAGTGGAIDLGANVSATISRSTFFGNACGGAGACIHVGGSSPLSVTRCILAYSHGGTAVIDGPAVKSAPTAVSCCDIYGNSGGDWVGYLAGHQPGVGNFSADPMFCDTSAGDLSLDKYSPCLPQYNRCGQLIGRYDQGCDLGFACGDANGDGSVSLEDVAVLETLYFECGPAPAPWGAVDVNCDGLVNVADVLLLLRFINGDAVELCCR